MLEDYSLCVVPTQHCSYPLLSLHYYVCRCCQSSGRCSKRHILCHGGVSDLISSFVLYKTKIFFYCLFKKGFFYYLFVHAFGAPACAYTRWPEEGSDPLELKTQVGDLNGTVVFCKSSKNSTPPLHLSHFRHKVSIIREPIHVGITKPRCTPT